MPTNCIYKSIDLVAGEKFVLPPGATVISVSDESLIESTCDGAFATSETLCYSISWAINFDTEGSLHYLPLFNLPVIIPEANNAWDNEGGDTPDISISHYAVAGTVTPLGSTATDFASLESALASGSAAGLLQDRKYNSVYRESVTGADSTNWNGQFSSGYTLYTFSFKAIPEVAATVYLQFLGESGNIGSVPRYFAQEIDCADFPTTTEQPSTGRPSFPASTTTTTTVNPTTTTSTTTTTTLP